ncbi:MAG: hypothetical protein CFE23_07670 [Flavobacterium sp. BFFFF1]|uniref:FecR family protein n=1 Tax=Flavobacterium sp. BFFFF1 TaxID=2015557 RepID=UPI000BD1FC48|nr:FecR family protein [Flavobacterium sp. BFFFF1]OYU80834.1 MAG: hypothetical protein CFE23_07670 [Flavobacterium sp. BFFFF1]
MENHETYLADWFEDRMTDEALQQLISKEEFLEYSRIKRAIKGYDLKTPELESHFQLIKDKMVLQKETTKPVIALWKYITVAASVFLCIGVFAYFSTSHSVITDYGQNRIIRLADHSRVHLDPKSALSYSNFFKYSRDLTLSGEAYFEAAKGSRFTVHTGQGTVTVLGTKFNVIASDDYFEVHCDEGRVRVDAGTSSFILTPGKSVRVNGGKVSQWEGERSYLKVSERSFYRTPASVVFEKIENQYGIHIDFPDKMRQASFTGAISNTDFNKAMQSICLPLHLKYTLQSPGKITVTNE